MVGDSTDSPKGKTESPMMVGETNEDDIQIEGLVCRALLDTGSTVSTMSESFFREKLDVPLKPMTNFLHIECADGERLSYLGYVEVEVAMPAVLGLSLPALLLVVPDTPYNHGVPVLLGTNVLRSVMDICQKDKGKKYLQTIAQLTPWWLTFRCLSVQDRAISRANGRLGLVKCASVRTVIIPANRAAVIPAFLSDGVQCSSTYAMLHSTGKTVLPTGAEVTPILMRYSSRPDTEISVEVLNPTNSPLTISPSALLCELQQVDIVSDEAELDGAEAVISEKGESNTETVSQLDQKGFLEQFDFSDTDLSDEQVTEVRQLLLEYRDIFSEGDFDIGHTNTLKHRIDLVDETPFKQRHRRIPPAMYNEVRDHLAQLADIGVIRPSSSPWASAVVLVRKKNGKLRFCTDFRQLNERTVRDSYALPRIEETIDHLKGSQYFSTLDLRSGYYQVELEEEHKARSAFTAGPLGFWEYNRMPFGLTNAPATFQRLMERAMGELHLRECVTFIDDVIVHGCSFEQEQERLRHVFDKIRLNRLKLNATKCEFFKKKVGYLGHVVSSEGIETDPEKTKKIQDWPCPTNVKELHTFLGFSGYYRKFVENYSQIAKPLTELLGGTHKGRKGKRKSQGQAQEQVLAPPWVWEQRQEDAFMKLKECLTSPPILAYADYEKPFTLHTDASGEGLGAVLYQEQDNGTQGVISYASRGLTKSERHYPAHKLEYLALKWAVTEKFRDYLYGQHFVVYTDNNPLTYVLSSAKLDATGHRWLAALSAFDFVVKYRPGKYNADADALSRMPRNEDEQDPLCSGHESRVGEDTVDAEGFCEVSPQTVAGICQTQVFVPYVETLCLSTNVLDSDGDAQTVLSSMSVRDWRVAQRDDKAIGPVLSFVTRGERPKRQQLFREPETNLLIKEFDHLQMFRGILYRVTQVDGEERRQLVLPGRYRDLALTGLHDDVGHMGRDRTLVLVRERFFWPRMTRDVDLRVKGCRRCLTASSTAGRAPLTSIQTTQPLEILCMDFLTLEMAKGGYQHILVMTDHFTRYALAVPTKNMSAKTTAEVFFHNFVVHYGLPQRIHSDQGGNFEGKLMKELCHLTGMSKSRTTPYHPMGNGSCERFNRTLLGMLRTLTPDRKADWKVHVGPLVHAYNATRHESTGFSPFYLMFGRKPRLAVDVVLGLGNEEHETDRNRYVVGLRERLEDAYQLASAGAVKAQKRQRSNYDKRARAAVVEVGDLVLVKVVSFDGKHKIADRWEQDVYVVQEKRKDAPVYVVQKEGETGPKKTLHRNLLLPIGGLPIPGIGGKKQTEVPETGDLLKRVQSSESDSSDSDSETDSETEFVQYMDDSLQGGQDVGSELDQREDDEPGEMVGSEHEDSPPVVDEISSEEEVIFAGEEIVSEGEERNVDLEGVDTVDSGEAVPQRPVPAVRRSKRINGEQDVPTSPSVPDVEEHVPPTLPEVVRRRSTRVSKPPDWQTSGDYVMYQCQDPGYRSKADCVSEPLPEWAQRARFLASLANENVERMPSDIRQAILRIVAEH